MFRNLELIQKFSEIFVDFRNRGQILYYIRTVNKTVIASVVQPGLAVFKSNQPIFGKYVAIRICSRVYKQNIAFIVPVLNTFIVY
jgi:hypothetical protein